VIFRQKYLKQIYKWSFVLGNINYSESLRSNVRFAQQADGKSKNKKKSTLNAMSLWIKMSAKCYATASIK